MAQYNPTDGDPLYPGSGTASTAAIPNTRNWRLGNWHAGSYPACVTFHDDRLCFAGTTAEPQRVDMSNSGQYEVFSPSALRDGTVTDANAISVSLNSNTVNAVRWMSSDDHGLILGTAGGPWLIAPASTTSGLTPTNVKAKQAADYGASKVAAVRIGRQTLYLQSGGKRVRDAAYDFYVDGIKTKDISVLAEHLAHGGFKQFAVQQSPEQVVWLVRNDGLLVSVSYDTEQNEVGWAQHPVAGTDAVVQSVAVIPSTDGTRDEVWLAVKRTINGASVVYVEKMSKLSEVGDFPTGEFAPGDTVYQDCAVVKTFGSPVTSVTGLTWLEGETVSVLADGATHPDVTVSSTGGVTLQRSATTVAIGLPYESRARTMRIEAAGADGTAQGKIKRINRLVFRLYETLGLFLRPAGSDADQRVDFRSTADDMDAPPPLYTGDKDVDWEGGYDREGQIEFGQSEPLPCNVSALIAKVETEVPL